MLHWPSVAHMQGNQLSGSSDAILAYAAGTRCPASCRSLARVYYGSRLYLPPVICRLEVRRAISWQSTRRIRAGCRSMNVRPIPDDISSFSADSKWMTIIFKSIDSAVSCQLHCLRDRHSQPEGSIKLSYIGRSSTLFLPPWIRHGFCSLRCQGFAW